MAAVAVIDWKEQRIYDRFLLAVFAAGVLGLGAFPEIGAAERLLGICIISVPMLVLTLLVPGAFGGGDIKLMAVCGWMLGWRANLAAFVIGLMAAGGYCVIMLAAGRITRKTEISLGTFLALGFAAAVFLLQFMARPLAVIP